MNPTVRVALRWWESLPQDAKREIRNYYSRKPFRVLQHPDSPMTSEYLEIIWLREHNVKVYGT